MVEMLYLIDGGSPPREVVLILDEWCKDGRPRSISYQEIVLGFDHKAPLLFTSGEVGRTEAMFYGHHQRIETLLAGVITLVRGVIASGDVDAAAVEEVASDLRRVTLLTGELARMPVEHFATFRRYLVSHPVTGEKGPSGAFSAKMPTLELLARGPVAVGVLEEYLYSNWVYFPVVDRGALSRALNVAKHGLTLQTLAHANAAAASMLDAVATFFEGWRRAHVRAAQRQLPEAAAGTGGEADPTTFLKERQEALRRQGG